MARRKDIRVAMYDSLEDATDGLVPPDNITKEMPHRPENFPAVVHSVDFDSNDMNRGMPHAVDSTHDSSGHIETETYVDLLIADFEIVVTALDDGLHSDIHGAVKDYFEKFNDYDEDEGDIHEDVHNVSVSGGTSINMNERSAKSYATQFNVELGFKKFRVKEVDAFTDVDIEVIDIDELMERLQSE